MLKYPPKENTYKEMYLINKFKKDIMENTLQNIETIKLKRLKITTTNYLASENEKEA